MKQSLNYMRFNFGCIIIWEQYFFVLFPFLPSFYRILSGKHHRDHKGLTSPWIRKQWMESYSFHYCPIRTVWWREIIFFTNSFRDFWMPTYKATFFPFNFSSDNIYIFAVNRFLHPMALLQSLNRKKPEIIQKNAAIPKTKSWEFCIMIKRYAKQINHTNKIRKGYSTFLRPQCFQEPN